MMIAQGLLYQPLARTKASQNDVPLVGVLVGQPTGKAIEFVFDDLGR
jgi:hypothetical protein